MISRENTDDCTFFRVTGKVTANEIILQAGQYMAGERTETSLWDFTRATGVKISTVEMKGIADSLKKISTDGKVRKAALVGSKRINIGLGKLFTAFAQLAGMPNTYKVFRDLDSAIRWLSEE